MKTASEYRAAARESLQGNWNKAAGFMFLLTLIAIAFSIPSSISSMLHWNPTMTLSLSGSQFFMVFLLIAPLQYAFQLVCMLLGRGIKPTESMTASVWHYTRKNYSKLVLCTLTIVALLIAVMIILGVSGILLIIGDIVWLGVPVLGLLFVAAFLVNYLYCLFPYIIEDEPELGVLDIFRRSRELMDGHLLSIFLLDLSFIGWAFLAIFTTGGIGILWLQPYMYAARGAFYRDLTVQVEL